MVTNFETNLPNHFSLQPLITATQKMKKIKFNQKIKNLTPVHKLVIGNIQREKINIETNICQFELIKRESGQIRGRFGCRQ